MNSDLRIGRVALREIRLELVRPFRTAAGETTYRRILLTELKDTDGTTAWGECVAFETPDYMPETVESAWEALESYVIPRVLDRSFGHPAEVSQALDRTIRGCNMAKASVEMPC